MGNQLGMSGAEQQVGKSDLAGRQVMILGHRKTRLNMKKNHQRYLNAQFRVDVLPRRLTQRTRA